MKSDSDISGLNDAQDIAVKSIDGPCLVIAGAGSGKTRVLTFRIAQLLKIGIPAYRIMALTFTNKAAGEMKERIAGLVGYDQAKDLWMGTFHSIFAKILRAEAEKIRFTSNYTIYDTEDSKSLIKTIIKELNFDVAIYKPGEVYSRISWAKNNLILPDSYINNQEIANFDKYTRKPELGKVYRLYTQRCKKANAMDFDDLLLYTNVLFRDHPEALAKYQERYHYILVDEYQDTNLSQYLILKKLAAKHRNICVVGDDAQSIYSFRGARIENILNFKSDYPDYQLYKLEQNYRSTKMIVNAANSLIEKNKSQIPKMIWSDNEEGEKIRVIKAMTEGEEGHIVCSVIQKNVAQGDMQYPDFAILYRTNAQSRVFEEALRKRNIPYKIFGGISFYQRREIKDLLAYFRLLINKHDDEAIKRIINFPVRGIGKTTIDKLEELSVLNNTSIWEIAVNSAAFGSLFNSGVLKKLKLFTSLIIQNSDKLSSTDAYDLGYGIANESGLLKELFSDRSPEGINRYENLQELLNGIRDFTEQEKQETGELLITLDRFIENVSLMTDADNDKTGDRCRVSLMTVHAAKGLEFKQVFIVGAEQDLFPLSYASNTPEEMEEERRLFYVALTRARSNAVISYARSRYKWGNLISCNPSNFINDIDSQYLELPVDALPEDSDDLSFDSFRSGYQSFKNKPFSSKSTGQDTAFEPEKRKKMVRVTKSNRNETPDVNTKDDIKEGMTVEHERFGTGTVLLVEGEMPNMKATVHFNTAGKKQLLLKFARLKVISS